MIIVLTVHDVDKYKGLVDKKKVYPICYFACCFYFVLINYFLIFVFQKRNELVSDISKESNLSTMAIKEGNTTIKSKKQLSQIIDTTLLKCYLMVNWIFYIIFFCYTMGR